MQHCIMNGSFRCQAGIINPIETYILFEKKIEKTSVGQSKYLVSSAIGLITICFYMKLGILFSFIKLNGYNMDST